ncbi:MAG TPA: hypothetical protein VEI07_02775 [Planctomycetaceae bacterium]|nr:hypothetical protein [Planctomycetaceae bacterium]
MAQLAPPPINPQSRVAQGRGLSSSTSVPERHPLGLPPGSVRALLCLIVVSFVVAQTARGISVAVVWHESLMIMLAHYFTTRRMVPLSKDLRARLEASGDIDREPNPLHLPKHTVRVLMVAAFAGLGIYLYRAGRLFEAQSLPLLVSVGAYLLGTFAKGTLTWLSRNWKAVPPAWWIDLKAAVTLTIVLVAVGLQLCGMTSIAGLQTARLEDFSLGLVLFYFGSR